MEELLLLPARRGQTALPSALALLALRMPAHRLSFLNVSVEYKGHTTYEQNTQCWIPATVLAVMGLPDIASGNEHGSDASAQSFTAHPCTSIFQSPQKRAQKA